MTRVKICCISSTKEARLAVHFGASAIGLVSEMPSGPGVISEDLITEIAITVPPPVATFLLTSRRNASEIIAQQRRCGVNTVQFCDRLAPGVHKDLRKALPGISLVQVIHVTGEESITEGLQSAGRDIDAILLDSGNQSLPVKELGGTGRTHDWSLSAQIVKESPVPVFLAGGLNPANVGKAIRIVRPFGVDVCNGVRTNGALDRQKLMQFMEAVAAAS